MIKPVNQLKTQAIKLLGEKEFNKSMQMNIVDLHKVFSKASLRNSRSKEALGYNLVIAYKHSGAKR